jgi:uncharacterized membrane protein
MLLASVQRRRSASRTSSFAAVVIADWLFTTPAVIVQPATGLYLMHLAGFPVVEHVARRCRSRSTWSGRRMLAAGGVAADQDARARRGSRSERGAVARRVSKCLRIWVALGIPAFVALVVVFY